MFSDIEHHAPLNGTQPAHHSHNAPVARNCAAGANYTRKGAKPMLDDYLDEPYPLDHSITWREHYERKSTCTTCTHPVNDHDAGECWKTVDGKQCDCGWMGAEGAAA